MANLLGETHTFRQNGDKFFQVVKQVPLGTSVGLANENSTDAAASGTLFLSNALQPQKVLYQAVNVCCTHPTSWFLKHIP
jgi:hypothetical protein